VSLFKGTGLNQCGVRSSECGADGKGKNSTVLAPNDSEGSADYADYADSAGGGKAIADFRPAFAEAMAGKLRIAECRMQNERRTATARPLAALGVTTKGAQPWHPRDKTGRAARTRLDPYGSALRSDKPPVAPSGLGPSASGEVFCPRPSR